ncbi:MAG: tyrosine-protein phosphatase [Bdellovibrionota bacterium]
MIKTCLVLILGLALPGAIALADDSPNIPVANFRVVDPGIYRSARPDEAALAAMVNQLELKTDLDLENADDDVAQESVVAAALGIRFISKPMSAVFEPKDQEIDEILAILADPANYPILVHCQHGQDRTGLVIGL